MPTTTKMGIVYPSSTDLVKDGATAMGTISTTVDAKTGLVLLNTTSFTAVSSQSINDVFSTNFTNYMIQVSGINTTTNNSLLMRLRVGGADNSSSNYAYTGYQSATNNTSGLNGSSTGTTQFFVAEYYNRLSLCTIQISNPFATDYTTLTAHAMANSSGTPNYQLITGGYTTVTTSYTGFTIYPGTSTMSGSVSVYGYNK